MAPLPSVSRSDSARPRRPSASHLAELDQATHKGDGSLIDGGCLASQGVGKDAQHEHRGRDEAQARSSQVYQGHALQALNKGSSIHHCDRCLASRRLA